MEGGEADDRVAARDAITATVSAVLRQNMRRSAHPADRAAVRREAAQIVGALEIEFLVIPRHSESAKLSERQQLREHAHE